ncbi:hypothetical protein VE00_04300 [Pseudogymnoascus sp. WSF 3629]|nr:hypothetical protein VE00_04300 [Pseudogymnoascus sp. WSF 3629]
MVGGVQSLLPLTRLMNALRSRENGAHIVLLIGELNGMKSRVLWQVDPIRETKMDGFVAKDDPTTALMKIRQVITVIHYINHLIVQAAMIAINDDFRAELHLVEQAHNNGARNTQIELVTY